MVKGQILSGLFTYQQDGTNSRDMNYIGSASEVIRHAGAI